MGKVLRRCSLLCVCLVFGVKDLGAQETSLLQQCVPGHLWDDLTEVLHPSTPVPWRSEGLLRRLNDRHVFNRVFVSVHQLPKYQDETALLIRSLDQLHRVPRLMLVDKNYPLTSSALLYETSQVMIVPGGKMDASQVILAHEIHLVGGHSVACLANTLADMLLDFKDTPHSTVYLFLYPRLIYSEFRLSNIILASTRRERPKVLRSLTAGIFRKELSDIEPAPPGASHDFEVVVADGLKVQVTFVK